ncbi:hypothetical protein MNEG_4488, partial [Monoraphidium neglectum]
MSSSNQDLAKKLPLACRNTALSAHDLQFDSFELRYGYSWHLSAADCVHALTGLLVRHTKIGGAGPGSGAGGGGGAGADAAGGGREQGPEDVREEQAAAARDDFWAALEALDVSTPRSMKLLKEGIDEAKALQLAVIKDGGLMITRRQLEANPAHHMQELNLQAIRPTNSDRFRHPLALLRLATFVRDAADVARTARKSKWPMAVVGPDDGSGYCCVIGIRHKQLPKQPQYNVFGTTFQQVLQEEADALKWDQERDGFDAAVVFVHKDSVPTFMTELKIRLGQQARESAEAAGAEAAAAEAAAAAAAAAGAQDGKRKGKHRRREGELPPDSGGGVFDGHGGKEVAEFAQEHLHLHFLCALTESGATGAAEALGSSGSSRASGGHSRGSSGSVFGPCLPDTDDSDATSSTSGCAFCDAAAAGIGAPAALPPPPLPPLHPATTAAAAAARALTAAAAPPHADASSYSSPLLGSCPPSPSASSQASDRRGEAVGRALRQAFMRTDRDLAGTEVGELVGSTAVVAVIGRGEVHLAHCGDSRAVLCRKGAAISLTTDHKPDRSDEAARVKASGGRVVFKAGTHRVMGLLAMSRALGDHFLRPYVIADPEITSFQRSSDDELLILATDGLWDVFAAQEAVNLALRSAQRARARGASRTAACRVASGVLMRAAVTRGSRDNITVVVVDLKQEHGPPSLAA